MLQMGKPFTQRREPPWRAPILCSSEEPQSPALTLLATYPHVCCSAARDHVNNNSRSSAEETDTFLLIAHTFFFLS